MSDYIHKIHPTLCDPKDFWGQIKRTVNGKPVSEDQILMIIEAIENNLNLDKTDTLLDLGCGNGALAYYIFEKINAYLGVDFSEFLVSVAKKNFEKAPSFIFKEQDILDYVESEPNPQLFTKALIYGCFSYLSRENAFLVLKILADKFAALERIYIGNLPDRSSATLFFKEKGYSPETLLDHKTPIGIWRTELEFRELCESSGWNPTFYKMPKEFYASHYRYDVLLTRKSSK